MDFVPSTDPDNAVRRDRRKLSGRMMATFRCIDRFVFRLSERVHRPHGCESVRERRSSAQGQCSRRSPPHTTFDEPDAHPCRAGRVPCRHGRVRAQARGGNRARGAHAALVPVSRGPVGRGGGGKDGAAHPDHRAGKRGQRAGGDAQRLSRPSTAPRWRGPARCASTRQSGTAPPSASGCCSPWNSTSPRPTRQSPRPRRRA